MLRFTSAMLLFMLILTACQSGANEGDDEGFPELSQEQLDQMLRHQPATNGGTQQVSLAQFIAQMEAQLAQSPNDTSLLYGLGKFYYDQYLADSSAASAQRSADYYSRVLQLDPSYNQGRAYYNRMLARLAYGEYSGGLQDIEDFVRVNDGRHPVNHRAMEAELLYRQGKTAEACARFAEAKAVAARDSSNLGEVAQWKQRCEN